MSNLFSTLALALLAQAAPAKTAPAPEALFQSGPARVALLELYSSEGCSDTPLADRWFSALQARQGLWERFVPVKFQVGIWDHLGWKDARADRRFTARQRQFAEFWGNRSVYTPGFAWGGDEWRTWSSAKGFPKAATEPAGTLSAKVLPGRRVEVRFEPAGRGAGAWTAHAALLGMGVTSSVEAGENEGRTLRHDFIALSYEEARLEHGKALTGSLTLPAPSSEPPSCALAVWVQRDLDPRPIQAAGGYLDPVFCR